MGKRTPHVSSEPAELEREIRSIRGSLSGLTAEADRRRHRITDLAGQIQRHPRGLKMIAGGLLLFVGSLAGLALVRRHHERKPAVRFHRLVQALQGLLAAPQRLVRKEPSVFRRALGALFTTVLATVVRRFAEQKVAPMLLAAAGHTDTPDDDAE